MGPIKASEIADFYNLTLEGDDMELLGVSGLNSLKEYTFSFSKSLKIDVNKKCLLLVPLDFILESSNFSVLKVSEPRLMFAKIVEHFFVKNKVNTIAKTAKIAKDCKLSLSVSIGEYTIIGNNVSIGKNTVINHNVVIYDNTIIGDNVYIKSGTIIGEDGFGFALEEDGRPVRIPHLGNVSIGDNVEIGAKCTVARGTLSSTVIDNNVKIDDQVHIGHNCSIGKNTIITACSEISGSVTIGKNCWISPNCTIIQKVQIGNNVTIGIGAIITKSITSNKKVMGFESLELRALLKIKKRINYGK